jgi:hypothetical protein
MSDDSEATTLMGRQETHGEKSGPFGERLALLTGLALTASGLWFGLPEIGLNPLNGVGLALSCLLLPLATMMLSEALVRILGRR